MPRQLQQIRVSQQTIARCALGRTVKETSLYVFQELNRVHWAPKDLMESRVFWLVFCPCIWVCLNFLH